MTIEELKKIVEQKKKSHSDFVKSAKIAIRYYNNKNDITIKKSPGNRNEEESESLMRKADNRVSNNYHQLLVDQKSAYTLGEPPKFDVGKRRLNKLVADTLGDSFPKTSKDLSTDASNCSLAWLHVWRNKYEEFKFAPVDPMQIIPVYTDTLTRELGGVLRIYEDEEYTYYQFWNDTECHSFREPKSGESDIDFYKSFTNLDGLETHVMVHGWGRVPFIPFYNNNRKAGDLDMYKGLIDVYDKIYNGFVNDIEDIQEVVMVLSGYGGESLKELNEALKEFKSILLDEDGKLDKLTIEIPTKARELLLEITRRRIFEAGCALDPLDERMGTSSGVALQFKYTNLSIKATLMETEFRSGFAELVRFVLIYLGKDAKKFNNIKQRWTRTAIRNRLEEAQIVAHLASVTSKKNIAKANPIVEDYEEELKLLIQESLDELRMEDDFKEVNPDLDGDEEDLDE